MYLAYNYVWFSFLLLLLKSLTTSLILSITLDYYFTFAFVSPLPLPSSLIGMPRGPGNGEMVTGSGWLFSEPHNWVRNKPPNISWALEFCVLPILSGLEACLSLVKAGHSFKWHIAEKPLSQSPEKKRETEARCLPLSEIWHGQPLELASQTLSGLGLEKAGLLCSTRRCKNKHRHKPKHLMVRNVLKVIKMKYYFQLSLYAKIKLNSSGCRN